MRKWLRKFPRRTDHGLVRILAHHVTTTTTITLVGPTTYESVFTSEERWEKGEFGRRWVYSASYDQKVLS